MAVFILFKMKISEESAQKGSKINDQDQKSLTKKVESGFITQQLRENENEGVAEL